MLTIIFRDPEKYDKHFPKSSLKDTYIDSGSFGVRYTNQNNSIIRQHWPWDVIATVKTLEYQGMPETTTLGAIEAVSKEGEVSIHPSIEEFITVNNFDSSMAGNILAHINGRYLTPVSGYTFKFIDKTKLPDEQELQVNGCSEEGEV